MTKPKLNKDVEKRLIKNIKSKGWIVTLEEIEFWEKELARASRKERIRQGKFLDLATKLDDKRLKSELAREREKIDKKWLRLRDSRRMKRGNEILYQLLGKTIKDLEKRLDQMKAIKQT